MDPAPRRTVVSFTRRGGRMTQRQWGALNDMSERFVIEPPRRIWDTSVDPSFVLDQESHFHRQAPLVVEVGTGRGEAIVEAAVQHPDWDFLGLEVYVPGVAQTLVTMRHRMVDNIRLMVVDAAEAFATALNSESVREVRIWFPDPWHKTRHHKRRLLTAGFVEHVAEALEPGGVLRFASDWEDYALDAREVISASDRFTGAELWAPRFEERPLTRFESKGLKAGHVVRDIAARRH